MAKKCWHFIQPVTKQDLIGRRAFRAWRFQDARCNCGCYGDDKHTVSGTASDYPAVWLGCPNCRGQALGYPRVLR